MGSFFFYAERRFAAGKVEGFSLPPFSAHGLIPWLGTSEIKGADAMTYGQVRDESIKLYNQYSLAGEKIERTYNNQADYLIRIPGLVDEAMQEIASGPRRIQEYTELRLDPTRDSLGAPTYLLPPDLMDIVPGGFLVIEDKYAEPRYDSCWARPDEWHVVFSKRRPDWHGRVFLEYYRNPKSLLDIVRCGKAIEKFELTVPTGATSIKIAGCSDHQAPALYTVSGDTETEVTLTVTSAAVLNGITGDVKNLDALEQKPKVGTASVTAGTTVRISGWAKPGDGIFAFYGSAGLVSIAAAPYEPPDCTPLDNAPETHTPIPYYVAAHLILGEDAFSYGSLYNEWVAKLNRLYQLPQPHRNIVEDVYRLGYFFDWGEY